MPIGRGQGQKGQEGGVGIKIEPKIKDRERAVVSTEYGLREANQEGRGARETAEVGGTYPGIFSQCNGRIHRKERK